MEYTPSKDTKNHMEKNEERIRAMEEKNRLKRLMSGKSSREKLEEERERGFSTHFAGANTSSKPVIAKPMVKANAPVKPIRRPKGDRKGWAIEPPRVGQRVGLDSDRRSDSMRSVSPITGGPSSASSKDSTRVSLEATEVEDDDRHFPRHARISSDDTEVSEDGDELEDSLDEDYSSSRRSTQQSYVDDEEEEEDEDEGDMYDEDFEEDDDTHEDDEDDEEEEVDFRPSRHARSPSPPPSATHTRETQAASLRPMGGASRVGSGSAGRPPSSGELNSLSKQYCESNTREKAAMRDSLEDSAAARRSGGPVFGKEGNRSARSNAAEAKGGGVAGIGVAGEDCAVSDLASRLQALNPDQQNKLLMMLNNLESSHDAEPPIIDNAKASVVESKVALSVHTTHTSTTVPSASPVTTPSRNKKNKRSSPRRKKKNSPARPTDKPDASGAEEKQGRKELSFDPVVQSISPDANARTMSAGGAATSSFGTAASDEVVIRIKLHNSWKKTKFSSLSALRMLVRGSDEEVDLSQFSVQVSTGNTVLPKTSDVVRNVTNLFARSRVAERKEWRFPVGTSTQLVLTGLVQGALEDYELLVWNGSSDTTCSPVQDADLYINNALVWTGVLEDDGSRQSMDATLQPSVRGSNLRHNDYSSRLLLTTHGMTRSPSNIIPMSVKLTASKRETVKTTISPISKPKSKQPAQQPKADMSLNLGGISANKTESSFTFSGLSDASDVGMSTTDFLNMESGRKANRDAVLADEPSWMTDFKTPREGLLSARSNSDISFTEPSRVAKPSSASKKKDLGADKKPLDLFYPDDEPSPPDSSRPGSRRQASTQEVPEERKPMSRGSRRRAKEQEVADVKATTTPFKPRKSRRETKKEEEEKLRQSMEALNQSDRRNRGRLEQELTTAGGGRHDAALAAASSAMPKITETEEVGAEVGIDVSPLNLEETVAVNLSNRRMRALEGISGGALDEQLATEQPVPQRNVLRQRSERIDQVQEKVSSALASLAGVMSTLPGQKKTRSPEHSTLKLSPTNVKSTEEGGPASASIPSVSDPLNQTILNASIDNGIDDLLAESYMETSMCEIPVLPKGRVMEIEVLSTWGDPYYVGLNGIDIFDNHGDILLQGEGIESIQADPSDINVLNEYHDDPRGISNVLDGLNFTRDDLHVWLAPHGHTLTPPLPYVANITIMLSKFTTISLLRIWNYNKSRTHCYRGVRRCRVRLDNRLVFEGEIRAAPGLATVCEDCSEVILFSTDSAVLSKVAAYDASMGYLSEDMTEEQSSAKWLEQLKGQKAISRPRTADKKISDTRGSDKEVLMRRKQAEFKPEASFEPSRTRPTTAAVRPVAEGATHSVGTDVVESSVKSRTSVPLVNELSHSAPLTSMSDDTSSTSVLKKRDLFECKMLSFVIDKTWGDKCYVGLAGVEVLIGQNCISTDIDADMIDAEPRDLSAIGCFDDPRTPDKLVDGVNDTTDDSHMWLIPFSPGTTHQLRIDLGASCAVAGFNIWNYNKSAEDALRGVRVMSVYADGSLVGRCEVRMAPGCDGMKCKQTIMLRDIIGCEASSKPQSLRYISPAVRQDYETPSLPSGTTWKFNLYCNWGDGYYIGLDGLQFLDADGNEIPLASNQCRLAASPNSLRELGMDDSRLPQNLSQAPHHDPSGSMSWLAPIAQCMTQEERRNSLQYTVGHVPQPDFDPLFYEHNILCVMFDRPVTVSVIRFFNYSKSPKRGVREMGIDVDGHVVFMGTLRSADSQGHNPNDGQAVVFTSDPKQTRSEKSKVCYCGAGEQDVLCINERQVIIRSKAMYEQPNVSMEGINSDLSNRPSTSLVPT